MDRPHLAFVGRAGAGKTTCARYVERQHGYKPVSFAGKLKAVARDIWGPQALTDRPKLQGLGNKLREVDPEVWLNIALREIDSLDSSGERVVVDDCRFPNEAEALMQRGFVFIRVTAPEQDRITRLQLIGKFNSIEDLSDVTETSLDDLVPFMEIANPATNDAGDLAHAVEDALYRWRSRV